MLSLTLRQTAILVLIFVVTSTGLIILDQHNRLNPLRAGGEQLVRPLGDSFHRVGRRLAALGGPDESELARQLAAVTAERDRLLAENVRLRQLEQEVTQLREQLGFQTTHAELRTVPASVIGRDPEGTHQYVIIDRGSNDGLEVGMAVVSPNVFVGQVTEVAPDRARVTLAIDASYQVGARLQRSGADGIVYGRWQAGGQLLLRYLDPAADVAEGDVVVTSGQTARVPAGLVIGKVARVQRNVQADTVTAEVVPLLDFRQLHSLTVILGTGAPQ
ncbi:MAG: rod shape-determining protein MreC [Sphaerobacter sp.]|nr:rod shape-determining protein MreC [Sphaerobacter sp.]